MKIFAATPFPLKQGGTIFLQKEPGFHLINDTLKGLGEKTAGGRSDMIGLDAIPSCIAHLIKIHDNMQTNNLEKRYCAERWRKVMVIYILSRFRGYDISIGRISEKNTNALVWEIFGKKLIKETEREDGILVLRFQGRDIALFDKKGYLLPIAEFPSEMEQELGENCILSLEDYEKDVLYTFLQDLLRKTVGYQYYIQDFLRDLSAAGAKELNSLETSPAFNEMKIEGSAASMTQGEKCFRNIPKLPLDLPSVFHPKLLLAGTEWNDVVFGSERNFAFQVESEGNPYSFSGFLPLSEKMVDFLQNSEDIQLNEIAVDESEFLKQHQITVKLLFKIKGEKLALKKCYMEQDIVMADAVPMISLFPYVDLPPEYWKKYYVVLKRNENQSEIKSAFKDFAVIPGRNIDLLEDSIGCSTEADKPEERQAWFYASSDRLPQFIKLCTADFGCSDDKSRNAEKKQHYIGCICAGKPKEARTNNNRVYYWALDMGTRNTISAWRDEQGGRVSYTLSRDSLYHSLISLGSMARDFAKEYYAPSEKIAESFTTMARIYKAGREGVGEICYEHGCALFPDLELIDKLMNKDANWEQAAIFTDIKFGENDKVHETALQIYILNMLWLGSLEGVLNGADEIKIFISYPRNAVKERIEGLWQKAISEMEDISKIKINISYILEAEANARYLQKAMKGTGLQVSGKSNFGICDIGDGTSDFNLYLKPPKNEELPSRIQFSMRYAGGDILVNTIMRFSEKNPNDFKRLWNMPYDDEIKKDRVNNLIRQYENLARFKKKDNAPVGNEGKSNEESKREKLNTYVLNYAAPERRRNIALALIENAGLDNNLTVSPSKEIIDFTTVLKFKYWNLFHVYGDMLGKFLSDAVSFKLFLYGGGRKALKFATGKPLGAFAETGFGKDIIAYLSSKAGMGVDVFSISLEEENELKTEVVEGMLEKEDAIKKRSISGSKDVDAFYRDRSGADLPRKGIDNEKVQDLLKGYQRYIQDVKGKDYFKLFSAGENIRSIYEGITVGEMDGKILIEMEKENRSAFKKKAEELWHQVTDDPDNPSCLWEVLFYMKMSNDLIMENIWKEA